jgi:hypothetical protein
MNRTPDSRTAFFAALSSAPAAGITPAALAEGSGAGLTWTHLVLSVLREHGAVTRPGKRLFAPVPGADLRGIYEADIARCRARVRALVADLMRSARSGQGAPS